MQVRRYVLLLCLSGMILINTSQAQSINPADQKVLEEVQKSHIDGNVPKKTKFNAFLKRDLEKYFSSKYGIVSVKWEFLREVPTQSGVAYPKYYLWTKLYKGENILTEGAVRVAAIEKKNFEVTDFINLEELKNKTKDIYSIFPVPVCEKILSRL